MPEASTIPPQLEQLLAELSITITLLSERTGISSARIIEIYEEGKPTIMELYRLLPVLGAGLVSYLTAALGAELARFVAQNVQIGLFNQGGAHNTQHNVVNNHINLTVNVNYVTEPKSRALVHPPQHWEQHPMQPGGQVRQMGAVVAVQELGRAA